MDKNMIWALFSVVNDYNQPSNNLVQWWAEKPSFDALAKAIGKGVFPCHNDETTLYVVNLWQGVDAQISVGGTSYRLELLGEGPIK